MHSALLRRALVQLQSNSTICIARSTPRRYLAAGWRVERTPWRVSDDEPPRRRARRPKAQKNKSDPKLEVEASQSTFAPEKPMSAFNRFLQEFTIDAREAGRKGRLLGEVSEAWAQLSEEEKKSYDNPEEWQEYYAKKEEYLRNTDPAQIERDKAAAARKGPKPRTAYIMFRADKMSQMGHDGSRGSYREKTAAILEGWKLLPDVEKNAYEQVALNDFRERHPGIEHWETLAQRNESGPKVTKSETVERSAVQPALRPKRPPSSFNRFLQQFTLDARDRGQKGRASFAEAGKAWAQLSEKEKKSYDNPVEWETYFRKKLTYLRNTDPAKFQKLKAKKQWSLGTKPRTAYMMFRLEKLPQMGHDGSRASFSKKSASILEAWKALPDVEKDVYEQASLNALFRE